MEKANQNELSLVGQKASLELFDRIDHGSLADAVVQQIEMLILGGVLKQGSKLPSERDLSEQFDVSRPKVREALQVLDERGLVRIQAGDGAYISQLTGAAMSPALVSLYMRHPSAVQDHLEYRKELEGFAARLAAQRATASDKETILSILEKLAESHAIGDSENGAKWDARFHTAIVNASHNRSLIHMMNSLYELNRTNVFFNRNESLDLEKVSDELLEQHRAIAKAVVEGDSQRAQAAAHAHLEFVIESTLDVLAAKEREIMSNKRGMTT
ncbi:FadR/GntR family transcriptional regulator [Hirschia maritima]|uniref:FadR/GntR family transcriptional regulator n=1 Tax=Hirschia maritima TaxID=1121961 RepID=UPI000362340F|nr:FadR/GntR family transcriptional regulator [Hirschia maritima]